MSYRKEKKYRLTTSDINKVKNILLAQNMKFLYPSRTISSCYFDSKDFISFHQSEEGVLPRKKIRVRWYNKLNIFNKETKISSIEGRFKYTENLDHIKSLDQLLNINIKDNLYGKLKPKIIVTYTREYFLINKLRVTFDRNISYNNLKLSSNLITRDNECVMEIKAPIDCDDDYIENLIPLTTSRFSKYSRGIEKTNSLFLSWNGDKYVGEFKDNAFNGRGVFEDIDGSYYQGDWKNGQLCDSYVKCSLMYSNSHLIFIAF